MAKRFVYLMASESGLVKVGIAGDVERRKKALEAASGFAIRVIETFGPYGKACALESSIHRRLASTRRVGEWFSVEASVALEAAHAEAATFEESAAEVGDESSVAMGDIARWIAEQQLAPMARAIADAEQLTSKYEQLVQAYAKLTDEFLEAVQMIDDYYVVAKNSLDIAGRAIARVSELERVQPSLSR